MKSMWKKESESPAPRKRTVLRTIRLNESLATQLDEAAAEDGISTNGLVGQIFEHYFAWARKARKFGFAYISKDMYRLLLSLCDSEKLEAEIREKEPARTKSMVMFWYQDTLPHSWLKFLRLLGEHSWNLELEEKGDGRSYAFTLHHDLGPNFTLLQKSNLDAVLRNELHTNPTFEEGDGSLTLRFTLPESPSSSLRQT